MKKGFTLFLICFSFLSLNAQKKEQAKDTVKTEVVNIVTKYNPKIADAKKINKQPQIKLLKDNKKKKLEYTIFSAPVASTFIPKSGVVKGIDVGVKERVYQNFLAAGYGNYATPYLETYLHYNTRFKNEFAFNAKYLGSQDNVRSSVLNSNFSNFDIGAFYKQHDRYFDWKVALNSERNIYNWYGLPNKTNYTATTTGLIAPQQTYNFLNLIGEFDFNDSFIDYGIINVSYFTDKYNSNEILANFDVKIDFPLPFFNWNLNDMSLKAGIEFLKGNFNNSYADKNSLQYTTVTAKLNPSYKLTYKDFSLSAGVKAIASLDTENSSNNIFLVPDVSIEGPIIAKYLNIYGGFSGGLHTNTFKNFTEENPYVSPTLFITQTLEKSNLFIGFNGKINRDISFHIKGSYKNEEDKPMFLRNVSKSNGTSNSLNGYTLRGYEYGNSFNVYYDDVKTTSIFTEIAYDFSKHLSFELKGIYNSYTLENALEAWNLPSTEGNFSAKYKRHKWFVSSDIFYVSERKDGLYNNIYPSSFKGIETVTSFVDVNLNGGYHFNDKFSAFLKLNNVLNTEYQRFANYDTQGFQALGGITYKFDF